MGVLVCDTYHGNVEDRQPEADKVENVVLTRDEVQRSRVRATTEGGREVGVAIDRRLRDGDIVHDGEVAVVVALEPVESFAVKLNDLTPMEGVELGHDLGNTHHEMSVEDGVGYVPADAETRDILEGLPDEVSFDAVDVEPSVFDGGGNGARGHGHGRTHGNEARAHSHDEEGEVWK